MNSRLTLSTRTIRQGPLQSTGDSQALFRYECNGMLLFYHPVWLYTLKQGVWAETCCCKADLDNGILADTISTSVRGKLSPTIAAGKGHDLWLHQGIRSLPTPLPSRRKEEN